MKMRYAFIALLTLGVAACSNTPKEKIVPTVVIVPSQKIEYPKPTLSLLPIKIDAPRDSTVWVTKPNAAAECAGVTENTNDVALKARCLEHPIVYSGSNLYRGYDRNNWDNVRINEARKDAHIKALTAIIDQINATIRTDNAEAKKKLEELRNVKPSE